MVRRVRSSSPCGTARFRAAMISALVAMVLTAGAAVASAQGASIAGQVTDSQGAAVTGVTVTATAPVRAAPADTVTDTAGNYELPSLAAGTYTLTFIRSGFAERRETVTLSAGARRVLDVTLELAALTETVDVVGVAPAPGARVPRDRVPAAVSVLGADWLGERAAPSVADSLYERLGTVSLEGSTTNLWQPTLRFRGFTASPLLGLPQGIAVYQNGVRVNEPFGDTVQFDLLPQFAMDSAQLSAGADPTYGLNALGGTLALRLKNGFDHQGVRGELLGGSFGRVTGTAELGLAGRPWALYVGASHTSEDGWRVESPSGITQAIADVAYRAGRVDAGASVIYADTSLNGNGAAPVELLAVDRSAVFTYPDTTENRLAFVQGRLDLAASPAWSVQATAYVRDLDRRTLNGDEAEFDLCDDDVLPAGAPASTLCAGGQDEEGEEAEGGEPLVDVATGRFITAGDAAGDGAVNRTQTEAQGYGVTLQAARAAPLGDRDNVLVLGLSLDLADVAFSSNSEVGSLTPDRTVAGSGLLAGIFGEAPDDLFNTELLSDSSAVGLYFTDTFSLTDRAHLTVSGRFNHVRIELADLLGSSLDGEHTFSRFNRGVGLVYQASERATVFGRYAESNRAPTAAELSCADPAEPCRVPNAFVSDPPLEQAVARSVEGGVRGRWTASDAAFEWSASAYLMRSRDDILFVASPELIGTGYFQNAGDTQRTGVDLDLSGRVGGTGWYASYGLVNATFESALELPGSDEVNDAATEDGAIAVEPGDRLPGIPRHSLKAGVRQPLTSAWDVAIEAVVASSRVFVGDEGNDQPELDGHGLVNLRTAYRFERGVELVLRIDNLFDARYETFGVLAELEVDLDEVPDASDPRFVGPGAPRSAFAGLRVRF